MPDSPGLIRREDAENWPRAFARAAFLELVGEQAPGVLEQLRSDVLPKFRSALAHVRQQAADGALPPGSSLPPVEGADSLEVLASSNAWAWLKDAENRDEPIALDLERSLRNWAGDWNLGEDWVLDAALRTMLAEVVRPEILSRAGWASFRPAWKGALSAKEMTFVLEVPDAWEPTVTRRSDAKRMLTEFFEQERDEFLDRCEGLARERGFVRPPEHRAAEKHLRWLVRYQVLKETFLAIAADETSLDPEASRKTVSAGVRRAAELIGLRLRPADRGAARPSS